MLRDQPITLVAAFLVLALCLAASGTRAAEKQIGLSCSTDNSSIDWDTVAQCNNTSFVSGPLILGAMTDPPYSSTNCSSSNAGMIQWTGSVFQGCNGTSWGSLASSIALSALSSSTTANTFDNAAYAQTWTWNSLAANTALSLTTTDLTSGTILQVKNTGGNNSTGYVGYFSNATTGTGYALYGVTTGSGNSGYGVYGVDNASGGYGVYGASTSGTAVYASGTLTATGAATAASFIPSGSSVPTNGMYLSASNTLDFATASTKALEFNSSQNATFAGTITSNELIGGTGVSSTLTLESTSGSGSSDNITFKTGSQATAMTINTSGKVGVGTTSMNGLLNVASASSTANATAYGIYENGALSATDTSGAFYGEYINPTLTATTTVTNTYGSYVSPQNTSSGVATNLYGTYVNPQNTSTGTVTNMYGVYSALAKTATGAVTTMTALYGQCQNNLAAGTVTTCYDAYLDTPVTTGTITTKYGLYQADSNSLNYFAGWVGILTGAKTLIWPLEVDTGTAKGTTANDAPLVLSSSDANNTALQMLFEINSNSTASLNYTSIQSAEAYVAYRPLVLNAAGGYVGIGTTSPSVELEVNGAVKVDTLASGGGLSFAKPAEFSALVRRASATRKTSKTRIMD